MVPFRNMRVQNPKCDRWIDTEGMMDRNCPILKDPYSLVISEKYLSPHRLNYNHKYAVESRENNVHKSSPKIKFASIFIINFCINVYQ